MKIPALLDRLLRPPFMRRIDNWLLQHWPDVWRLQVHWVLAYSVTAIVVLFVAGYLAPVTAYSLGEDSSYYRFSDQADIVSGVVAMVSFLLFFAWRNKLSHFPSSHFRWNYTLLEILLYFLCIVMIFIAIFAFGRGHYLKGKLVAKVSLHEIKEYLEPNNYFFPAYLPHYSQVQNKISDQYFHEGEVLAGLFLKRSFQNEENWDYYLQALQMQGTSPLEAECLVVKYSQDSVKSTWGKMAKRVRYSFYGAELGEYRHTVPQFPLLFKGLTYEEGKHLLVDMPFFFLDTTYLANEKALRNVEVRNSQKGQRGNESPNWWRKISSTSFEYQRMWFGYDYVHESGDAFQRVFAFKAFLESLNPFEKETYSNYLHDIAKIADSTALVFEYETIIPSNNNSITDKTIFSDYREKIGYKFMTSNDEAQIVNLNVNYQVLYSRLDSLSRYWYYNYLTYCQTDASCPLNEGACLSSLVSSQSKQLDSLLLFDFFYRNKYYYGLTYFHYNQYLDYYFKKYSSQQLDSLQSYMQKTGWPLAKTPLDTSNKTLLFTASNLYKRSVNIRRFDAVYQDRWIRFDEEEVMFLYASMYLAIFMFFLTNTSTSGMLKNFVIGIIILTLATLVLNLLGDARSKCSDGIFILFMSGLPAIATILFLLLARFRSKSSNLLVQLQIVMSFVVCTTDPRDVLGLAFEDYDKYESLGLCVFLYWSILLVIIAILFRRHQSLPEKT